MGGIGVGACFWGEVPEMALGPLGLVSHLLCRAGRGGVSGVSCNLYFAEVKHISWVGGSVFCGIGAWPVCLGDSPTPSADAPDSAPAICRLPLTTAPSFTQPLLEPPAPLPRLSSWGLQGSCVSGKGRYHRSSELEASSTC